MDMSGRAMDAPGAAYRWISLPYAMIGCGNACLSTRFGTVNPPADLRVKLGILRIA
jgi:hypothetical protein